MKKTASTWEYKVGINVIIAKLVCMWKSRMGAKDLLFQRNEKYECCMLRMTTT